MNQHLKDFISEKFKTTGKALDLGAGDLLDVASLKKLGWECEGVDIKTGVDLEKGYASKNNPFDLVYSNYLLHKLKNKKLFIQTVYENLKEEGWFFIHTFDESDQSSNSNLSQAWLKKILADQGFEDVSVKVFRHYDDEKGHEHWHKILEATGRKNSTK